MITTVVEMVIQVNDKKKKKKKKNRNENTSQNK